MSRQTEVLGAFVLGAALLFHWLPLWRRQNLWFSVTVPPGFRSTPAGRAALARYRAVVWLVSAAALAGLFASRTLGWPWLAAPALLAQPVGASAAFASVRRRVRPFGVSAAQIRSATLAPHHEGLPGGTASVIGPLGMLAVTAIYLRARWRDLPDRFPIHWTLNGTPNGWATRSWTGVYGPLLICAIVVVFQLGMAEVILRRTPRGRVPGTEHWTTRFRRANLVLLVVSTWGMSVVFAAVALSPLRSSASGASWIVAILPLALVLLMVPFVVQIVALTRDARSGSDGTPDSCWKLGLFYYNPADPAIMVEKRFGVGYTFNFGHAAVWLVLGAAVLLLVAIRLTFGGQ